MKALNIRNFNLSVKFPKTYGLRTYDFVLLYIWVYWTINSWPGHYSRLMIPDLGHCVYCFKSLLEVVSSADKEHDEGDYSSNCSRTKMTLNVMIHLTRPKGSKLSRGSFNYDNTTSLMWTLWWTDMSYLTIQDKTEFKWRFLKASYFHRTYILLKQN